MPSENEIAKEPKVKKTQVIAMSGDTKKVIKPEPRGTKRPALAAVDIKGEGERNAGTENEEEEEEDEEDEEDEENEGEDEGGDREVEQGHGSKRLKTGPSGPVEFTEDDIAWQLEAMAEEYGLDEEDLEEGGEMTEEENISLFKVHNLGTFSTRKRDVANSGGRKC